MSGTTAGPPPPAKRGRPSLKSAAGTTSAFPQTSSSSLTSREMAAALASQRPAAQMARVPGMPRPAAALALQGPSSRMLVPQGPAVAAVTTPFPPAQASWFRVESIHEIEKRGVPEFFTGRCRTKTPQVYKEYRDFIVVMAQQSPSQYVSVTQCRRSLAGDVCSVTRIHQFLEHWGLINRSKMSSVDAANGPALEVPFPPFGVSAAVLAETTPSVVRAALAAGAREAASPAVARQLQTKVALETRHLLFAEAPVSAVGTEKGGASFAEMGKVEAGVSAEARDASAGWTESETTALLESLVDGASSWEQVEARVGRPRDQCLVHFLRLPIDDESSAAPERPEPTEEGAGSEAASLLRFLGSAVSPALVSRVTEAVPEMKSGPSDQQREEVRRLVCDVALAQIEKVEAKLAQLRETEQFLQDEWSQYQRARKQLIAQRLGPPSRTVPPVPARPPPPPAQTGKC